MTNQINMEEFNKVFEEAFEKDLEEINAQLSQNENPCSNIARGNLFMA